MNKAAGRKVAGIGCRSGVTLAQVLAALNAALAAHDLAPEQLDALATIGARRDEPALQAAARHLGLPLVIPASKDLANMVTPTSSPASLKATGLGSASEAVALAAAGPGAFLVHPRLVAGNITCAIAISKEAI